MLPIYLESVRNIFIECYSVGFTKRLTDVQVNLNFTVLWTGLVSTYKQEKVQRHQQKQQKLLTTIGQLNYWKNSDSLLDKSLTALKIWDFLGRGGEDEGRSQDGQDWLVRGKAGIFQRQRSINIVWGSWMEMTPTTEQITSTIFIHSPHLTF